jgi:serine/threonine protein kinase
MLLKSNLFKKNGFKLIKKLGEGRYGRCYLIDKDGQALVIKLKKPKITKEMGFKASFEEQILKLVHHPSIPKYIQKIDKGFVMEYAEGHTFEYLIFKQNRQFGWEEIKEIALQIVDILEHLHQLGVVHRDIRVPNTIYHHNRVTLVDFGLARFVQTNPDKYSYDVDFHYLADFIIHLFYTQYTAQSKEEHPWYEELSFLPNEQLLFLKRLMKLGAPFKSINEVKDALLKL